MYLKPIYNNGEEAEIEVYCRKDGAMFDPFVIESVKVFDPEGKQQAVFESAFQIKRVSTGIYKIVYDTATNSLSGTWKTVWTIKWLGTDSGTEEVVKNFFLERSAFDASTGQNYALKFIYNLLNNKVYCGEKRFLRFNIEEIYDRPWNATASMEVVQYLNKWNKPVVQDWTSCFWENQEMCCLFDTTKIINKGRFYARVKLELTNGETVLTPFFKLEVVDGLGI